MSGLRSDSPGYARMWNTVQVLPSRAREARSVASRIFAHKRDYDGIVAATHVPYWYLGPVHYREADLNFNGYLGNGDSIHRATIHVPRGRGPFASFTAGGIDAIRLEGLANLTHVWTPQFACWAFEKLNGFGYLAHGENSPYVWGGTNYQQRGKYTSDGSFDPNTWDTQLGAACIMKELFELDPLTPKPPNPAPIVVGGGGVIGGAAVISALDPSYLFGALTGLFIIAAIDAAKGGTMWEYIIQRLKEPSTWAGFATIGAAFGLNVPTSTWQAITQVGIALAGAIAVLRPEGTAPKS